jgi:uncharacterized protein YecE (DUF72 family)
VEINSTFYRLPDRSTLEAWATAVPRPFVFACKASQFITHRKKLRDPEETTRRFFGALRPLDPKLGPILFQLPSRWRANAGRLGSFLEALPRHRRYAFEFRDRSWFTAPVLSLLERHNAALCAYDLAGFRSPVRMTADFAYVRLHGPAGAYRGRYDGRALAGWAKRFRAWQAEGRDVYCFFDNDEAGFAAQDAMRLQRMLNGAPASADAASAGALRRGAQR